ncbi:MAG: helix-turn-helix domain-containing protein [Actinobacteria bacterium]|nr:helix-turn-helix domain-containing protein [Actinomycetota bacterium]
MLAKNSTKEPNSVDRKLRRFNHDLDYAYMNIPVDSEKAKHRLGRTLRALRRSRNWTLEDFEKASDGRIKAVVLGSYERGSRSISVSKLEAIAAIYEVPITAILIHKNNQSTPNFVNVVIDLRKLHGALKENPTRNLLDLNRFTSGIIDYRKDLNGEILSLRNSDLDYLSIMASLDRNNTIKEYADLNILFKTKD